MGLREIDPLGLPEWVKHKPHYVRQRRKGSLAGCVHDMRGCVVGQHQLQYVRSPPHTHTHREEKPVHVLCRGNQADGDMTDRDDGGSRGVLRSVHAAQLSRALQDYIRALCSYSVCPQFVLFFSPTEAALKSVFCSFHLRLRLTHTKTHTVLRFLVLNQWRILFLTADRFGWRPLRPQTPDS